MLSFPFFDFHFFWSSKIALEKNGTLHLFKKKKNADSVERSLTFASRA